ncbi:MAG: pyridoxal-phosphate dependent enzyme [Actinomycetia bacterium]|nr:pyridoxal-phosphate dependent enzyme [Actinomycetes bacterium]
MSDAAVDVVREHLRPTPLIPLRLERRDGMAVPVFAKLETQQPTGSFKVRGALAACAAQVGRGTRIVTASAGNHGLGVAFAATRLGVPATVVVPETASPAKIERLRRFAVDLRLIGADYDAAEAAAIEIARREGVFVSPYNDEAVIAGQGTLADELLEQADAPATVIVPVGGGGLAAGVGRVLHGRSGWRVIGVETVASRGLSAAVAAGAVVTVPVEDTIADGLAGNLEPGSITPGIVAASGVELHAAHEPAIRAAVRELALDHGLVVEGSAAVGLAALRAGSIEVEGPVILVLTGRNIAGPLLAALVGNVASHDGDG